MNSLSSFLFISQGKKQNKTVITGGLGCDTLHCTPSQHCQKEVHFYLPVYRKKMTLKDLLTAVFIFHFFIWQFFIIHYVLLATAIWML